MIENDWIIAKFANYRIGSDRLGSARAQFCVSGPTREHNTSGTKTCVVVFMYGMFDYYSIDSLSVCVCAFVFWKLQYIGCTEYSDTVYL